jgi:hypothetical protein
MKAARTVEQLDEALTEALAWRRLEVSALGTLLNRAPVGSPMETCVLRSGIAMLYAHWEGFIREASQLYAAHVAARRLRYAELAAPFLTLAIRGLLYDVASTKKAVVHRKLVDFFTDEMDERCKIPFDNLISAQSNLTSEVFSDICHSLGIDYTPFQTRSMLIDERLVRNRNAIAHGEYLAVDRDLYKELRDQILDMMSEYRDRLSNAAAVEDYKKTPLVDSIPVTEPVSVAPAP